MKRKARVELRWEDSYIYIEGSKDLVELRHGNLSLVTDFNEALEYTIEELKKREKPAYFQFRINGIFADIDYENDMFRITFTTRPLPEKFRYWIEMPEQEIYNFADVFFFQPIDELKAYLDIFALEVMFSKDFCLITEFPYSTGFLVDDNGNLQIFEWFDCVNVSGMYCPSGYFSPVPYVSEVEKVV